MLSSDRDEGASSLELPASPFQALAEQGDGGQNRQQQLFGSALSADERLQRLLGPAAHSCEAVPPSGFSSALRSQRSTASDASRCGAAVALGPLSVWWPLARSSESCACYLPCER